MNHRHSVIPPFKNIANYLSQVDSFLEKLVPVSGQAGLNLRPELADTLRKGKRIRPALVILSAQLFSENLTEFTIASAAAIEAIHLASLLHDDVTDEALFRRGTATLNSAVGNRYAIIFGDYMLALATDVFNNSADRRITKLLNQSVQAMTLGQLHELQYESDLNISFDNYLQIINGKTASLMAFSAQLGCLSLQEKIDQELFAAFAQPLEELGSNLGLAFQITDDMLDVWGSADDLGKPTLNDIAEGKLTLPLILTLQQLGSGSRRDLVASIFSSKNSERYDDILQIMEDEKIHRRCLDIAGQHAEAAEKALSQLPHTPARTAIRELISYILSRSY